MARESGDVWRWDGTGWHRIGEDVFPRRQAFGLAYDAGRRVVVLSGGVVEPGSAQRHQDVWEWSGDPVCPPSGSPSGLLPDQVSGQASGEQAATSARRPARSIGCRAARLCSASTTVTAPPSSSRARSTIVSACRPRAARSRQRPGMPGGATSGCGRLSDDQLVGHLRPPAGDIEGGERVGRLEEGAAQLAVGFADVRQRATRRRASLPDHGRAHPVRHQSQAAAADDDGLPGVERGRVEGRWATQPDRVAQAPAPRSRTRWPRPAAARPVPASERDRAGLARKAGHGVRRVVADHGVEHRSGITSPRNQAVAHQARTAETGSGEVTAG